MACIFKVLSPCHNYSLGDFAQHTIILAKAPILTAFFSEQERARHLVQFKKKNSAHRTKLS
jgi:hypothetical protein